MSAATLWVNNTQMTITKEQHPAAVILFFAFDRVDGSVDSKSPHELLNPGLCESFWIISDFNDSQKKLTHWNDDQNAHDDLKAHANDGHEDANDRNGFW